MKTIILLLLLQCNPHVDQKLVIINNNLYEMSDSLISELKSIYNIHGKDIVKYMFNKDSCYVSSLESVIIPSIKEIFNNPYKNYQVKAKPLFVCEGNFVNIGYINSEDIESIEYLSKDITIQKYGCKGLDPIFLIKLKKGKKIQEKPVGNPLVIN